MSAEYDAALEISAVLDPMSDYLERMAKALERLVTIDNGGRTDKAIAAVTAPRPGGPACVNEYRVEAIAAVTAPRPVGPACVNEYRVERLERILWAVYPDSCRRAGLDLSLSAARPVADS
jgi:hypothetical protein